MAREKSLFVEFFGTTRQSG